MEQEYSLPLIASSVVLERSCQYMFLTDMFRGIWVSVVSMAREKLTVNFPHEKVTISPRMRGEHCLRRYPSGEERHEQDSGLIS